MLIPCTGPRVPAHHRTTRHLDTAHLLLTEAGIEHRVSSSAATSSAGPSYTARPRTVRAVRGGRSLQPEHGRVCTDQIGREQGKRCPGTLWGATAGTPARNIVGDPVAVNPTKPTTRCGPRTGLLPCASPCPEQRFAGAPGVLGRRDSGALLPHPTRRRIVRRMPRLQVYLPNELYRAVKERQLPASELLQRAVRAELRRLDLLEETDRYLSELVDEVGEPSTASLARAERIAQRVRGTNAETPKAS